jgi:hypothetical protein
VRAFADTWFEALSEKAPLGEMLAMLTADGLKMTFPEATLRSNANFTHWYATVRQTYFDQVHNLHTFDQTLEGSSSAIKLMLRWEARTWTPPAAKSEHIVADVNQTWKVDRSPTSGRPVIVTYCVDEFTRVEPDSSATA